MNANTDLKATYGWTLCPHARVTARARGVQIREILEVTQNPELTHTAFDRGPGRYVYKLHDLAVVVVPATKTVITVLWNNHGEWTDEEFNLARAA